MNIQIRVGVFETNSSSTHSLTIVKKEEYDKWVKGEYVYLPYDHELVEKEGAERFDDPMTYEEILDDEYLEFYEREYTTEKGDTLVIFGQYGYNG